MTSTLALSLDALLTGTPALLAPDVLSAMGKTPRTGPVRIGWLGLEGDMVADPINHGGHDKAVHLVPQDHYPWWREAIGDHPLLHDPGAFGENLATRGATERELCLGDRFVLGSSLLEISHGRQPCSKLNARFGRPNVLAKAVESGRCGLYLRVIREGEARAGDVLTLTERPHPDWPIHRVFELLVGGRYKSDPAGVAALARMSVLAGAWRSRAEKLAR
ncbi:MOSC domain-containing protein [Sphingobium nicotianae]|uniref:MOSC domain-containing protein n=1 Tax=Sphingobium nicotianae TaxID=2782607 RepID=A0A9X1AK92_9SPHN|nr:MOSC domain-containing protein [Sphingobium nicotianae]MBT2185858.1 MOSC domain-containing protein [Sphingobium nicotianae]